MGKFDKKIAFNGTEEPDAPSSIKQKKKHRHEGNDISKLKTTKDEKDRNLRIIGLMGKEQESKVTQKGKSKADAYFRSDKMARREQQKTERRSNKAKKH